VRVCVVEVRDKLRPLGWEWKKIKWNRKNIDADVIWCTECSRIPSCRYGDENNIWIKNASPGPHKTNDDIPTYNDVLCTRVYMAVFEIHETFTDLRRLYRALLSWTGHWTLSVCIVFVYPFGIGSPRRGILTLLFITILCNYTYIILWCVPTTHGVLHVILFLFFFF